jgi:hypothetical protein
MATKTNRKHKALSVSNKLEIIKVDAQPHVMHTKVGEQLSIPVSTLSNTVTWKPEETATAKQRPVNTVPQHSKIWS